MIDSLYNIDLSKVYRVLRGDNSIYLYFPDNAEKRIPLKKGSTESPADQTNKVIELINKAKRKDKMLELIKHNPMLSLEEAEQKVIELEEYKCK